jgi:HEAT repeat protein
MTETKGSTDLVKMLLDNSQPFPAQYLHVFSDITEADFKEVKKIWSQITPKRKINLLQDLEHMMEADTLLSCDDFARFALDDEDANVRSRAISLLWECEDPKLAGRFAEMLSNDPSDIVRAAAASALGKFVLMGELEEISRKVFSETIDLLLKVYTSELSERVRQEILRSLSYSGQRDITIMIQEAFLSDKKDWKIAALESMGRSADNRWKDHVISTLDHSDEDYQYEAIRAAGELELKPARLSLLEMLMEDEIANSDLRFQVIWALSKIGGESVYETLQELLDNAEDDDEIDVLELALENLEFTDDNTSLDII